MKLALIGNYGATNSGDEAILASILKSHPRHEWTVFSANPEETRNRYSVKASALFPLGVRSFFRFGFRKSIRAMRAVEAVVVGGGGLFQDSRPYACFLWAWQVFWAQRLGKPVFIYATGVGPLGTRRGRRLAKWAYDSASGITVRDRQSHDLLVELGVDPKKIEVTADPAFLLGPSGEEKVREPHSYLVSVRPFQGVDSSRLEALARFLLKLKADRGALFTFVSMQGVRERDHEVLGPLAKRVGGVLVAPKDFSELVGMLEKADFAIGMRYHFLIAALLANTPSLALGYSSKVASLFEGELAPYCMPIEEISAENLERKMSRLSLDYNKFKLFARRRAQDLAERATRNVVFLEDFIKTLTKTSETDKLSQQ
jgi:polysaccharide pyruvyl transferase CsaB